MKIENVMTKNIISADIDDSIEEISKLMLDNDIGFIPIKEKNKIIGILTDRDIVVKILANKDNKIKGYLSTDLITIDINKSIDDVLKLMGDEKVKRVLVTEDENIIGIISLSDIINKDIQVCKTIRRIWNIENNKKEDNVKINGFKL